MFAWKLVMRFLAIPKRVWSDVIRVLGVSVLLVAIWFGFLWLVGARDVEQVNALILVWLSGALLFLAVFPDFLRRLRSFEFRGFKLEFDAARGMPPLRIAREGPAIFTEKAGPDELASLLRRAAADRSRSVLLEVDIGHGGRISLAALHLYLFLLGLAGNPTAVVFRSRGNTTAGLPGLQGVIDAQRLERILRRGFPGVWRSLSVLAMPNVRDMVDGREPAFLGIWKDVVGTDDDVLTTRVYNEHIAPELTQSWIAADSAEVRVDALREAIAANADWVLMLEGDAVVGLLNVCQAARRAVWEVSSAHKT